MLIGIDASQAAKEKKTGVENFCYQLIRHLLKFDHSNSYILYSDAPLFLDESFKNAKILVSRSKHFWHNLVLPKLIKSTKPDVFLSPGYMIPMSSNSKMISIVHDLAYKFFPNAYSRKEKFLQKIALDRAASKASAIIFISKNTKADFMKYYPDFHGISGVVYQGYGNDLFQKQSAYRPTKSKYILSVGRLEERKNIKNLVQAYGLLRKGHPEISHKLILAGKRGYRFSDIEREIKLTGKFASDITMLGYVKDDDLPSLYKNADIYVYPSLYEGFGIPVLEAFASGTPVACSNTSSIPEAAGDAAFYFDPLNPTEIANSMYKIIDDNKLKEQLRDKAKIQLTKFKWEDAAKQVIDYFKKVNDAR